MGCNCKTVRHISYLNKKYGENIPKSRATHIRDNVGVFLKETGLLLLVIPFLPLMAVSAIFTRGPINIGKFVKRN